MKTLFFILSVTLFVLAVPFGLMGMIGCGLARAALICLDLTGAA